MTISQVNALFDCTLYFGFEGHQPFPRLPAAVFCGMKKWPVDCMRAAWHFRRTISGFSFAAVELQTVSDIVLLWRLFGSISVREKIDWILNCLKRIWVKLWMRMLNVSVWWLESLVKHSNLSQGVEIDLRHFSC